MSAILLGLSDGILRVEYVDRSAKGERVLDHGRVTSIAVDRHEPRRAYASTWDHGLWLTTDDGRTWSPCGTRLGQRKFSRIAIGPPSDGKPSTVYVGTEPSALYASIDRGLTFVELEGLQRVPSRTEWAFPPRPYTHHVWTITVDPFNPAIIHVGIELGGIISSFDGGQTWRDRQPIADPDCHTLRTHHKAPNRLYEAGGAWYCESRDQGETWVRDLDGIPDQLRYFYSMVVDPGDPDVRLLTAAKTPFSGQYGAAPEHAWSTAYRKIGNHPWQELGKGFPPHEGNGMGWFASDEVTPGEFFYVTPRGDLYHSDDQGESWRRVWEKSAISAPSELVRFAEVTGSPFA